MLPEHEYFYYNFGQSNLVEKNIRKANINAETALDLANYI